MKCPWENPIDVKVQVYSTTKLQTERSQQENLPSIKAKKKNEGVALKTTGRHERGNGRGCGSERGEGLQNEMKRWKMRGGGTEMDGCGKVTKKATQTGGEFKRDEKGQHKREREEWWGGKDGRQSNRTTIGWKRERERGEAVEAAANKFLFLTCFEMSDIHLIRIIKTLDCLNLSEWSWRDKLFNWILSWQKNDNWSVVFKNRKYHNKWNICRLSVTQKKQFGGSVKLWRQCSTILGHYIDQKNSINWENSKQISP